MLLGVVAGGSEVTGRVVEALYTLPFLPVSDSQVEIKAAAVLARSQVVGEKINRLVNIAEMLDEYTLLHAVLIDPLVKLQTLAPNETVVVLIDALVGWSLSFATN